MNFLHFYYLQKKQQLKNNFKLQNETDQSSAIQGNMFGNYPMTTFQSTSKILPIPGSNTSNKIKKRKKARPCCNKDDSYCDPLLHGKARDRQLGATSSSTAPSPPTVELNRNVIDELEPTLADKFYSKQKHPHQYNRNNSS